MTSGSGANIGSPRSKEASRPGSVRRRSTRATARHPAAARRRAPARPRRAPIARRSLPGPPGQRAAPEPNRASAAGSSTPQPATDGGRWQRPLQCREHRDVQHRGGNAEPAQSAPGPGRPDPPRGRGSAAARSRPRGGGTSGQPATADHAHRWKAPGEAAESRCRAEPSDPGFSRSRGRPRRGPQRARSARHVPGSAQSPTRGKNGPGGRRVDPYSSHQVVDDLPDGVAC